MIHLDYLDGWRGLAIAFLLIGHFFPVPGINLGQVGVHLFFVLSGLLMGRLLFVRKVGLGTFYKRRFARVFPTAYFFIAMAVLINIASNVEPSWWEVFTAVTFTNNYWAIVAKDAVMPFGHLWSLSVEEHSYVVLSLVAVADRRGWVSARWATGLLSVGCVVMGFYYWTQYSGTDLGHVFLHTEVAAFGIFASAFLAVHLSGRATPVLPANAVPALFIVGLAAHWWSVAAPVRIMIGLGCFALALNMLDGAPAALRSCLSVRPLRLLGLWSFSIYVWQQPFYLLVSHRGMDPWLGVSLGIACGLASFYLLENPARLWLNRRWSPAAAVPATLNPHPPAV